MFAAIRRASSLLSIAQGRSLTRHFRRQPSRSGSLTRSHDVAYWHLADIMRTSCEVRCCQRKAEEMVGAFSACRFRGRQNTRPSRGTTERWGVHRCGNCARLWAIAASRSASLPHLSCRP